MTDQDMHDRLLDAGERWRDSIAASSVDTETTDVTTLQVDHPSGYGHHRRSGYVLAAAAAVVAAAAGITVAVVDRGSTPTPAAATGSVAELRSGAWNLATVNGRPAGGTSSGDSLRFVRGAALVAADCRRTTVAVGLGTHQWTVRKSMSAPSCRQGDATAVVTPVLTHVAQWSIRDHQLAITSDRGRLTYVPAPPAPGPTASTDPAKIVGHGWTLVAAESKDGTPVGDVPLFTVRVRQHHVVFSGAEGGDSTFAASVGDGVLHMQGSLFAPRRCPDDRLVYQAMRGTMHWVTGVGDEWQVTGANGAQLIFVPGAWPSVPQAGLACH